MHPYSFIHNGGPPDEMSSLLLNMSEQKYHQLVWYIQFPETFHQLIRPALEMGGDCHNPNLQTR